jgi:SAM-dependent methyltransferase
MFGDVSGKSVLCLASGGGQQSAAFAVLGARVTVFDLCEGQLESDRKAAERYGLDIRIEQGDMRDLSRFGENEFDIVCHAHSINFIPSVTGVFDEVRRVLKPGGSYAFSSANPFAHAMYDGDWCDGGYRVYHPYVDGLEMTGGDPMWDIKQDDGSKVRVRGPREWLHALSTLINSLIERDFRILAVWEERIGDPQAQPGSWEHFTAMFPPFLSFWTRLEKG